ncbi:rhodanese-like domain-containing protein [Parvicella tangerina]|uniref:Thiosulfate sulfurtransferase GlpE n=1 Tax=Parvicella tangerina TaxID=2829795 RepID=A0A916NGR8_9FLAO|nr:rhodanese-like domain-containing protein [Parvicella tangerina]CAG5080336.1 Thiosulfate sulfurtransferase GlpE [Parvicella tangerina]
MKNFVIVLLALSTVFVACNNTDSGEAASTEEVMNKQQRVSKATFKAFLDEHGDEVQLVDVRTPEEYGAGTIDGAKNMDFYGPNFASELESLDKDKPVMIFCKSGGRSGQTLEMMKEMGFSTVLELEGGYSGWE